MISRRVFVSAALAIGCRRASSSLLVFSAASTADAMNEAASAYRAQTVRVSSGGSGNLARQIAEGAPADVFLSADESRADAVVASGRARGDDRHDFLANRLVVVSNVPLASAADLARCKRIALGDPKSVPAGAYAKQWLEGEGAWSALASKVVPTLDVRAALAAVESGAVDAAVVYRTDAATAKHVHVAFEPPKQPRIVYPLLALLHGGEPARRFVEFLSSRDGRAIFERHGFSTLP